MIRALALACLLATPTLALAHEPAPADWWEDVAKAYGMHFDQAGRVPVEYEIDGVPSVSVYETGIGGFDWSTTLFFTYFCNVNNGDRWVFLFNRAGGFEDRHGVRFYFGQRLPCR